MNDEKHNIIFFIIAAMLFAAFLVGWLFPVEGPFDYVYDEYASQPAHRHPTKIAPKQPPSVTINVNDLSEEDFEILQEIFVNLRK